jgi:acetolactate synthase-1/3 small subunit
LSVLVENKAGVLARVSGLFARRAYNIFSLAVAPTDDERFSRITIVVDVEATPLEQITKQLFKLVNVVKISELHPDDSVERELMLATVKTEANPAGGGSSTKRSEIVELVNIFGGRIVDVGFDAVTVTLAGKPRNLDDFEDLLRPFGIVELQRTGRVALPQLDRSNTRLRSVSGKVS